jgi:hypothetical protein
VRSTRADGYFTVEETALLCGVKPITVYKWVRSGYTSRDGTQRLVLPVKREGGRIYIDPVEAAKAEYHTAVRARRVIIPTAVPTAA